jgi:hypothetical protein
MVQVNADSDRRQTALAGSEEPSTSEEQGSSEEHLRKETWSQKYN